MIKRKCFKAALILLVCLSVFSCAREAPVKFSVGYEIEGKLFAKGRAAREGTIDFSKPKVLEYRFDDNFKISSNSSLVIEYELIGREGFFGGDSREGAKAQGREEGGRGKDFSLVLAAGVDSWMLPLDVYGVRYAVPIHERFGGNFSITLSGQDKIVKDSAPVFQIHSLYFSNRWFGFNDNTDEYLLSTPFVQRRDEHSYMIDAPENFLPQNSIVEIIASFPDGKGILEFNGRRIEALSGAGTIYIPPSLYKAASQVVLSSQKAGAFYINILQETVVFPKPIKADPALVISWPKENWRNKAYEVFSWDGLNSLLIFDFTSYAAQDKMLKRLAFFTEKAGFRGRLAQDREIAEQHGWNAHDYRAEDLASFFDAARKTNFPLLDEEKQLKEILLIEKIIKADADGSLSAGRGGIISISRESADYLRYRFMAHEGFHGLFFIDEDFRSFSRRRLENLSPVAKKALISFFEFQQYDVKDEYLLINEFMAHVLQQPVSAAAEYFGKNLPQRLESSWRAAHLPKKDEASGTWPALAAAFTTEAEAFSAYVNQRWGLAAGRVWKLRVN